MVPAIEPVTADDTATMDAWYALTTRCHAHDAPELPPLSRRRHDSRLASPGFARRAWVVRDGAMVVAAADVSLPLHDNLDNGFAHVLVDPAHRRRGLGSRLLAHLAADAVADGRRRLLLGADERLDAPVAGSAFLRAAGARLGMRELQRRLALPPANTPAPRDPAAAGREGT